MIFIWTRQAMAPGCGVATKIRAAGGFQQADGRPPPSQAILVDPMAWRRVQLGGGVHGAWRAGGMFVTVGRSQAVTDTAALATEAFGSHCAHQDGGSVAMIPAR